MIVFLFPQISSTLLSIEMYSGYVFELEIISLLALRHGVCDDIDKITNSITSQFYSIDELFIVFTHHTKT